MSTLRLIRAIREIRGRILRLKSVSTFQFDFSVAGIFRSDWSSGTPTVCSLPAYKIGAQFGLASFRSQSQCRLAMYRRADARRSPGRNLVVPRRLPLFREFCVVRGHQISVSRDRLR